MRRLKRKARSLGIIIIVAISATTIITASIVRKHSFNEYKEPLHLNDTISNAMSDIPELKDMDRKISNYIRDWHIKGAAVAIMRNDSLVYAKGYGWADQELGIKMEPHHIMRVASVSKLITAVGIMVLQDQGKLNIKDTVFGPTGIMNDEFFCNLTQCDTNFNKITVENLLRHNSGFYRDPVFSSLDVRKQLKLDHPPTKEDYYGLVLSRKLVAQPGEVVKYSNFGYMLLSDLIEKVSGLPYEEFICNEVLKPAGCFDMHISGNYYADKRENEVRNYTHEGDGKYILEYNGSGKTVERCYGGNNIPLLMGAGAWSSSVVEMARLIASIDGQSEIKDIISTESFELMTHDYGDDNYGIGWNYTNEEKGWNRTGTLSGTNAVIQRYPDGECWIMFTNTSTYRGPHHAKYTEALFNECRSLYSDILPKKNMFE